MGTASAPQSLEAVLQTLPLAAALLTDAEGAVLVRAGDEAHTELQRMAATFAQTVEHAGKLGMGKSSHTTAFYDKAVVVHVSVAPLVLTLLADSEANVGLLLDAVPRLSAAVEPMVQAVAEANQVRATLG